MLSINTNLSSIMVQFNLAKSTFSLDKAIERMTTGYKINHASDNAAGYSIAQNMISQLSSYDVAAENISMGIDMMTTAQDTINLMQRHGERIHNLITQAQNGTYGEQSLSAINSEIAARIAEINRIYENAEYNGINILKSSNGTASSSEPTSALNLLSKGNFSSPVTTSASQNLTQALTESLKPKANGFIADIEVDTPDVIVTDPTKLSNAIKNNTKVGIGNAETLAELAKIVNGTGYTANDCLGKTIILTDDIDLSAYHEGTGWTPIGKPLHLFRGNFDGQGHIVKNIYINSNSEEQGLFGETSDGTIKNIGVEGYIKGASYTGGLIGWASRSGSIINCYSNCTVNGNTTVGGLVGNAQATIINSYSTGNVTGNNDVGGLTGRAENITNCFATGNVTGNTDVGGLSGNFAGNNGIISKSCSVGNVNGKNYVGGFVGKLINAFGTDSTIMIKDCASYSEIEFENTAGSFIGIYVGKYTNPQHHTNTYTLTIDNCSCVPIDGINMIEGYYNYSYSSGAWIYTKENYNMSALFDSITEFDELDMNINLQKDVSDYPSSNTTLPDITTDVVPNEITLQIGINGDNSSQISFNCGFVYDLSSILTNGAQSTSSYDVINKFLNDLSNLASSMGAISNRLESALESTSVAMENVTSSLSTIRDADIAKVSSDYIRNQILQQTSATLLATANQSPSIALQLI